jgi:hypothetical protein
MTKKARAWIYHERPPLIKRLLGFANGKKTYIAAAGFLGLAIYEFTQGKHELAIASLMAALATFGLRQALKKDSKQPPNRKDELT